MITKGIKNIVKSSLILLLLIAMIVPQAIGATAISDEMTDWQEESASQFALTVRTEEIGQSKNLTEEFEFIVEFREGESYVPYAEQEYILYDNEADSIGDYKRTDKEGRITLIGEQMFTIPELEEAVSFRVTEDISAEEFPYTVTTKLNDEEEADSNIIEGVIDGNDSVLFTNTYIEAPVTLDESPTIAILPETTPAAKGTWGIGADNCWVFRYTNGQYARNTWERIVDRTGKEQIYYFDNNARMLSNWYQVSGHWYYAVDSGELLTGWHNISGKTYYFGTTGDLGSIGRMYVGWNIIASKYYYFEPAKNAAEGQLSVDWRKIGNLWFYFEPTGATAVRGAMRTGWQHIGGQDYYFDNTGAAGSIGKMLSNWQRLNNKWYYFNTDTNSSTYGRAMRDWQLINRKWYYLEPSGAISVRGTMKMGWQRIGGQDYYLEAAGESGEMVSDWKLINNKWYYFNTDTNSSTYGRAMTDWKLINNKWYYLEPSGDLGVRGTMRAGWQRIGSQDYYLGADGKSGEMLSDWKLINNQWYYFNVDTKSSAYGMIMTSWQLIGGKWYYLEPSGELSVRGQMRTGWVTVDGKEYYLYEGTGQMAANVTIDGRYLGSDGSVGPRPAFMTASPGAKTVKNLLQNAMKPAGSTIYIWGGGHDAWSRGGDGVRIGVNPNWQTFFNSQPSNYDFNGYRFEYGKGLDCSGYIGWAVYNTIETQSNVMATGSRTTSTSTGMPEKYANNSWGTHSYTSAAKFTPGDIVSKSGHVWIVIGQCSDGSVVLVHSTPHAGVQLAGTASPVSGQVSEAVSLAQTYMKRYYNSTVVKFRLTSTVARDYLQPINRFQWDVSGNRLMRDPEGYIGRTPNQILADLFGE